MVSPHNLKTPYCEGAIFLFFENGPDFRRRPTYMRRLAEIFHNFQFMSKSPKIAVKSLTSKTVQVGG